LAHRHGAEHHHQDDGDGRQPREDVRLQRGRAVMNGEALGLRQQRRAGEERAGRRAALPAVTERVSITCM